MMRFAPVLLAALSVPVLAQDQDVQRLLIQRQQQTDAFTLQLRQSQERLNVPPGDIRRQQEIDAKQLAERQRLDNVSERQLRDVTSDTPQELRPFERQKADDERRPIVTPHL